MRSRAVSIVQVTAVEGPAVFAWLYFARDDPLSWWIGVLVIGEVLETIGIAYRLRGLTQPSGLPDVPDRDGRLHRRRILQLKFFVATPIEVAIWVVWLAAANRLGQLEAAPLLLVLMHLKHQFEAAAINDTPYTEGLFGHVVLLGSAAEVAGAVICLALLKDGDPVLAAAALATGFIAEHALLINALLNEVERRDLGMPRLRRPPATQRSRFGTFLTQHGHGVWNLLQAINWLRSIFNRRAINILINRVPPRPNVFSTMHEYTSWASLTDRTWSGRHLPAMVTKERQAGHPPSEDVAALFRRPPGQVSLCPKSTMLFAGFAQWFVDGFLRTQRADGRLERDTRRNESNHDVDLSQLYGLNAEMEGALRTRTGGRLRSQWIFGEEYPLYLCWNRRIKPEYHNVLMTPFAFDTTTRDQRAELFAMGTDVRNLGFVAFNVLFLREHNRIARELEKAHDQWDDQRLFATARMVLTVILLRIVVEEYVNHITPAYFRLRLPLGQLQAERWQRPNWMAVEFDLLYRWHSLIPERIELGDFGIGVEQSLTANRILMRMGLGPYMKAASGQRAGRIALFNTDPALVDRVEKVSIEQGRIADLRPYNDYRALCGMPPLRHFGEFSTDPRVREGLRALYDKVDDVELFVGLFAEESGRHDVLPPLMSAMVAFDALSQIMTNPLLSPRIYGPQTFSKRGMELIAETNAIRDLITRNCRGVEPGDFVGFTRENYGGP